MHREGGVVGLDHLVSLVPANDWVWSVLDFDGIGHGPSSLGYADFREAVSSSQQGYVMSWRQVQEFAAGVQQCFDLLLVAARDRSLLDPERFAASDFSGCPVVLAASDSTWWVVEIDANVEEVSGLPARLRARYGDELR